jgi:hypothetical protein
MLNREVSTPTRVLLVYEGRIDRLLLHALADRYLHAAVRIDKEWRNWTPAGFSRLAQIVRGTAADVTLILADGDDHHAERFLALQDLAERIQKSVHYGCPDPCLEAWLFYAKEQRLIEPGAGSGRRRALKRAVYGPGFPELAQEHELVHAFLAFDPHELEQVFGDSIACLLRPLRLG